MLLKNPIQLELLSVTVCFLAVTGCAQRWSSRTPDSSSPFVTADSQAASYSSPVAHATFDTASVRSDVPSTSVDTAQEIDALVREVREKIALTLAEENELRNQLAACRFDERPAVAKRFRSTLAYRQEILSAEKYSSDSLQADGSSRRAHSQSSSERNPPAVAPASSPTATPEPTVQLVSHTQSTDLPTQAAPLPNRGSTLANQVRSTDPLPAVSPTPVAPDVPAPQSSTWQEHLAAAVEQMESEIPSEPGNTEEVADHMRLGMLHLIAGDQEAALKPLPGASTAEQDYWSKQLFALSTYLDTERQPDRKRRAAGTLLHLDQARSRLAEIASLQITNASFVTKVDGYGLYELAEKTTFQPGQQVALYAEVENFRSESSQDGYRTSLATSYEVLDPQGRRVEGAQFPEIEDHCRNLRHDFHMQYGVILPTRIYPGEYELRLTITDQLSNKIAQTSIPFEIAE